MTAHEQHRSKILNYSWYPKYVDKNATPSCVHSGSWLRNREHKVGLEAEWKESGQRLGSNCLFSNPLCLESCFIFRMSSHTDGFRRSTLHSQLLYRSNTAVTRTFYFSMTQFPTHEKAANFQNRSLR